jgi:putative tricarboxylic transport membrane protein
MISKPALPELLLGLGIFGLGLFLALETQDIKVAPVYARVGPTMFPWIVAAALMLLGAAFAAQAWRRGRQGGPPPAVPGQAYSAPGEQDEPSDWRALALISAALWLQILLLERLGFVVVAAILFFAVAFAFGSRRFLRDGIAALALAAIVYGGLTAGLNLQLPAGILAGIP